MLASKLATQDGAFTYVIKPFLQRTVSRATGRRARAGVCPRVRAHGPPAGPQLLEAADKSRLATREDVAREVTRLLADEKTEKPRVPRFFREFFGYHEATEVFNFDNHPILRGKWVRERLLGGSIPDLPITVDAQLPDDPKQTLRERMTVTKQEYCWNCHAKMNPVGLPFEMFDHFGRHRVVEPVLDAAATERNVDKKGKSLGPVLRAGPLGASGSVELTGDRIRDAFDARCLEQALNSRGARA